MKDWYCYIDNQAYGPYPENLLRELIERGQLTADTYVYNDSPEEAPKEWQRAGDTEIAVLFLNNAQVTQSPTLIQNQWTARVSPEAPEENAENLRHGFSDEGEAQTFSSNNAYEPGRRQFEEETKSEKLSVMGIVANIVGILACLLAAEGLNRFGGLVAAFDGEDTPFYTAMLIISLSGIVLFVLSWIRKLSKIAKWVGVVLLAMCALIMLAAPQFPVTTQIFVSFIVGIVCLFFARIKQSQINFQYTDQSNQKKTRSFADFSKKQIAGLIGLVVVLVLALTITLGGRNQQLTPTPRQMTAQTQAPTLEPTQTPTSDIDKKDAVYKITYSNAKLYRDSIGSVWVRAIVEITNEGTSDLYLESGTLDLENESGSFVATLRYVSAYPKVISPGQKAYYYEDTTVEGISANTALTIVAHPKIYKAKIGNVRFPVTDLKFVGTTNGGVKVSGRVENTRNKDERLLHVAVVLYDTSEKPIAVLFTFADVAAGDKMGFETRGRYLSDAVKCSVYAYPSQFQF
ncbi:MAG: DUF4339 domain-containing protein [Synergistaceae bacterium]|jgi:hypothetical protein|nr:DUF4339 domain-containing protein [Synergistaceae bacterium]